MKVIYRILIFLFVVQTQICFAQKVTNITVEQLGQSIQVSYNLETELPCNVSLYYSTDNGAKWQGPLQKVSGDVGDKIIKGNHKINWDVLSEIEQLKFDAVVFKVDARLMGLKEVKIGNQIWSAENLNTDRFANGDLIPEIKSDELWKQAGMNKQPAWCNYNNDSLIGAVYGKLYNWYAVADPRGLCPLGWKVPSDFDWNSLLIYLGGSANAGAALKEKGVMHWPKPNSSANNISGFSALPGGTRYDDGSFWLLGSNGYWWSSTVNSMSLAIKYIILSNSNELLKFDLKKSEGSFIRCIKQNNKSNGFGYDLSNRKVLSFEENSIISPETGTVVINIVVNKEGEVISASGPARGSTTTSSNLVNISKEAALKTKFEPSNLDLQKGTMTFRYFMK
jgi:uncharacterized protein (TIGR02145 family)